MQQPGGKARKAARTDGYLWGPVHLPSMDKNSYLSNADPAALDSIYRQADDVAQRWEGGCPIQIGELVTSVAAANALLEKTQFLE